LKTENLFGNPLPITRLIDSQVQLTFFKNFGLAGNSSRFVVVSMAPHQPCFFTGNISRKWRDKIIFFKKKVKKKVTCSIFNHQTSKIK
jgi:hypothetical protein